MNIKKNHCSICNQKFKSEELYPSGVVSQYINNFIKNKYPNWSEDSFICTKDLNEFRALYVRQVIQEDMGEISHLEEEVLHSIKEHEIIVNNLNKEFEDKLPFGDRLSDKVAKFGGSWKFIILFSLILIVWILLNTFFLTKNTFDPYPFILLNLILSSLAAFQAPIIMMSQNRQSSKDRLRSELDYKINLKAELEIRHLKLKLDQLATNQWRRLLEIQELQTDLMEELIQARQETTKNK